MRTLTRGLPGALATAAACAAQAAPGGTLALRTSAVVAADVIRLADLGDLSGGRVDERARLAQSPVGEAPRLGQPLRLSRRRVAAALPPGWTAAGAAEVVVTRASQQVSAAALCAQALKAVRARLADAPASVSGEVACRDEAAQPVTVAAGSLELDADSRQVRIVDGPQTISVKASIQGRPAGQFPVPVSLAVTMRRWCAATALPADAPASPEVFQACRQPVRHEAELTGAVAAPSGLRLRRAIRAGASLAAADLVEPDAVVAGDEVAIRYRAGSFKLETRGTLAQDARLGDVVRVRVGRGPELLSGRLVAAGIVDMEEPR